VSLLQDETVLVTGPVTSVRVVIADDQPVVREGLSLLLEALEGFDPVGCASTCDDLLRVVRDKAPHVVLLGAQLGGNEGLVACQRIKLRHPEVGILLFPTDVADDQVYRALLCGVNGVVLKNAPVPEVLEAICTVARGDAVVGRDLCADAGTLQLSVREREVVRLLADGLTNRDISRRLFISVGTTKRHVENIARKLGTNTRAAAAAEAIRRGLVA
jgi:DNA-binding NarL/FixJ family response regulator